MDDAYNYNKIAMALEYIGSNFKKQPDLDEVAEQVHLSPFHFQRLFTEWAGVSPKKFLQFINLNHAKKLIDRNKSTMSDAAFDTGLSSTSRLHDLFVSIEGMSPGEYKNFGEGLTIHYSFHPSPFGDILIATTPKGICNLAFIENADEALKELKDQWKNARLTFSPENNNSIADAIFLRNPEASQMLRINLKGTPFQLKVWEALLRIPEGALLTYSELAESVGSAGASRAVGTALSQNPIAFLIPCHRVIKKVGGIGEYRWGSVRKMAIIGWEASKKYAL